MSEAWYVLGDFNSILHSGDKIRGNEVLDSEIRGVSDCMEVRGLHEIRSYRAYFSWSNKTIWSRINRELVYLSWYVEYIANSLSDHTPLLLAFLSCPKPKSNFIFCVIALLCMHRPSLKKINRDKCADRHAQQAIARDKLLATNIYSIYDNSRVKVEGFEVVVDVMSRFHKDLRGKQLTQRCSVIL
ncbi:hypothetical protein Cgig2_032340 [Carnegiea gigantea]|uniref:Uncharacterized protein n=1 Tax=Carnegiea gigantea TaxID=171969 RepID=A0A9Q1JWS5_9CARY|nr:hypothetical protein Cgig2_032340 [Carnegiea gigantea]